jgi:type I restriction enzyme S subunit
MNHSWPTVSLGEVLKIDLDAEPVDASSSYNIAGVYSFGKGLFKRGPLSGSATTYKVFHRLHNDSLVLSNLKAWEGAIARVTRDYEGWFLSPQFTTFNILPDRLDVKYLEWYCKRSPLWEELRLISRGMGARRDSVHPERFLSIKIPLPPLPEQRRIVAKIEALATKIEKARCLRHKAADEAEAVFAAQVSALFQHDDCWRKVEDAIAPHKGAVRSGPFGSQLLHEEFTNSGVVAIGTRDVQTNRFKLQGGWFVSEEKFEGLRRYQVFPGDVLCTIVGASIGRFCVVPENIPLAFTTKHIQALTLHREKVDPWFVSYMLNFHRRCRDSLFAKVEGSAQPSLNAAKVLGTALPLPSLKEQRRIVAYLDGLQAQLDTLKELQTQTAAELDALLPAILDRAFKGGL